MLMALSVIFFAFLKCGCSSCNGWLSASFDEPNKILSSAFNEPNKVVSAKIKVPNKVAIKVTSLTVLLVLMNDDAEANIFPPHLYLVIDFLVVVEIRTMLFIDSNVVVVRVFVLSQSGNYTMLRDEDAG